MFLQMLLSEVTAQSGHGQSGYLTTRKYKILVAVGMFPIPSTQSKTISTGLVEETQYRLSMCRTGNLSIRRLMLLLMQRFITLSD